MNRVRQMLYPYIELMRLNRPIGFLLLMWPTLGALWIASEGKPDPLVLVVFVLGVILMRSAGCAINDFADRHVDGQVWRTRQRPLAVGTLQARDAVMVFAVVSLLAFGLVLLLNKLTIMLSLVALLLALCYPFMKRYTYLPQLVLGMAFGWAIPMVFAAQTGTVPVEAWLLFLANILWTTVYDTFYAMADRQDDLRAGIKSTAILFGDKDLKIQAALQVAYLMVMVLTGMLLHLGTVFFFGLLIAAGLFIYQLYLCREREPHACLKAFLNNNWLGLVVFTSLILHYW